MKRTETLKVPLLVSTCELASPKDHTWSVISFSTSSPDSYHRSFLEIIHQDKL